uniref:microfibril-associated glycoprotein 4-like n=1 Tax=Ciona intestinalis TaxID=7719 RepID=UPI000180D078|nr:microfibril-associated glycoprotein 4-like [Ciona intestinalis]|eukprot:XP_002129405.1 microfibril-associated glycoprotein 4-like [Ciona intestinalis]
MIRLLSSVFILALVCLVNSQVILESCRVECGHVLGVQTTEGAAVQAGPPGKKGPAGPVGPKGQKGDEGQPCTGCGEESEVRQLREEVNNMKQLLMPRSCQDVSTRKPNWSKGGVYTIYPNPGSQVGIQVYCDLVTDGGGWVVFQRRKDGSENFFRGWNDYVSGFGNLEGELWLGLDVIHNLTANNEYEMRVDLEDFNGNKTHAVYSNFVVSVAPLYALAVSGYSGNAGSAMISGNFSTKDRDQDTLATANCAESFKGGWWYTACHAANLNGLYLSGQHDSYANGVNWRPWRGYHYSLKISEMKLRRK